MRVPKFPDTPTQRTRAHIYTCTRTERATSKPCETWNVSSHLLSSVVGHCSCVDHMLAQNMKTASATSKQPARGHVHVARRGSRVVRAAATTDQPHQPQPEAHAHSVGLQLPRTNPTALAKVKAERAPEPFVARPNRQHEAGYVTDGSPRGLAFDLHCISPHGPAYAGARGENPRPNRWINSAKGQAQEGRFKTSLKVRMRQEHISRQSPRAAQLLEIQACRTR